MAAMVNEPIFASLGKPTGTIDVRLSYRIIELFSEGLYASPNKAIEELVANSFDAGAQTVQVLLSSNLHEQSATIVVIDDGSDLRLVRIRKKTDRVKDEIEIHVTTDPGRVRVEVIDHGAGALIQPRSPSMDEGSGWGLHIVDRLSDRWGFDQNGQTLVWFEIDHS